MTNTNRKYILAGMISLAAILGWNVFLIQRDQKMFDAHEQAIHRLMQPPSKEIR